MRTQTASGQTRASCVALVALVVSLPSGWCSQDDVSIRFHDSNHQFSNVERDAIQAVADAAAVDARRLLPTLPRHLLIEVHAGQRVVPETGETGYAVSPNIVYWTVDPGRSEGVMAITQTQRWASLFGLFYRLVRHQMVAATTPLDDVVTDGMAIAFARDFAGVSPPPWSKYQDDVKTWVNELMALRPEAQREYLRSHPRRWASIQIGTFLVDQAMRSSGQSSAQLVSHTTDTVLRMALGR